MVKKCRSHQAPLRQSFEPSPPELTPVAVEKRVPLAALPTCGSEHRSKLPSVGNQLPFVSDAGDENQPSPHMTSSGTLLRPSPIWPLATINASWMGHKSDSSTFPTASGVTPKSIVPPTSALSPLRPGGCFRSVSGRTANVVRDVYRSIDNGHQLQSTPVLRALPAMTSSGSTTRRLWSPYSDEMDEVASNG